MADPSVNDARALARKHNLARCVVFFTTSNGRIGYASYGKTRQLCDSTRQLADRMWDHWSAGQFGGAGHD